MQFDEFLNHFQRVQKHGNYFTCQCPAHDDNKNSLSITLDTDRILVKCHAGFNTADVLKAARLKMSDLFLNPQTRNSVGVGPEIIAIYDYQDAEGKLLFQCVRYSPKDFRQRRPDGKGGFIWNLDGITPVLYHLPEVIQAVKTGVRIIVTEGEKDIDNIRKWGYIATTSPMGAGKWRPAYTETLKGAHEVVLIAHKDSPGRKHMETIASELYGKVANPKLFEMPDVPGHKVKDFTNWVEAGGTKEEFKALIDKAEPYPLITEMGARVTVNNNKPSTLTDYTNAELLSELCNDLLRYDHKRERWLIWDKNRWKPDIDATIVRYAINAARERYRRAADIQDLKERQRIANWAIGSENRTRLDACIALTKSVKPIADSGENWDNDPWLLGVPNGVVDLRTGGFRPGLREDRITMTTSVEYDPDAKAPRFEQFIEEVFNSDKELIDWMWRNLGYSITGDMSEQIINIGYGEGGNGKGKLTGAIRDALGDYAYDAPFSTFELYNRSSIPNDLAALEHRRFVSSSETNDGTRLNEARLKAISGGDPITARYLHAEFFTFQPECKIWLFVNHKPVVQDDSVGFWRRARLTPFLRQFSGAADDKKLGAKLKAEAPGVLALLVKSCLEWQKRGLDPIPQAIQSATGVYKAESDPLSNYLSECFEDNNNAVKASEAYRSYSTWAETNKLKKSEILNSTAFGTRMSKKYKKVHKKDGWYYIGIRPKDGGTMVADLPEEPQEVTGLSQNPNVGDGLDTQNELQNCLKELTRENLKNPSQPVTTFDNPSPDEKDPYHLSDEEVVSMLDLWHALDQPEIPLNPGKIVDLEKFLSDKIKLSFHPERIAALRSWYSDLKDGKSNG